MARRALVFGASGAIGGAVAEALAADGCEVVGTTRSVLPDGGLLAVDPFEAEVGLRALDGLAPFDAVVWSQGANVNDSLLDFDLDTHIEILMANCVFVSATLAGLLHADLLRDDARLCVISSIWQTLARPQKYSYTVSKAALAGLVHSASADLAPRGMLINAVLPGVVDTAMTRSVLEREQIDGVATATGFGRLTTLADVAGTVAFLCSERNTGTTGQSIAVDLGFSTVRHV
jgi:NAD(P)-dependent dehydrogenase (short-subunit alcohol dehydrogenase family)